ncbi:hypothetical protein [Anaplasma marginale]|uniref:hypothetical protein n=1 Tax=Anaplasma marginale TaxID=770 RepID=UPI0011ED2FE0|nr:hypothetical protein [Anaplasma marginale]TZF78261.1 hypothetical protein FY180_03305 [Anaplasma marginale]
MTSLSTKHAHHIAVANTAHAVSGVLISMGILLASLSILAVFLAVLMYFSAAARIFSLSATNAATVCAAVALLSACIVFCSVRDLVKSCKQVKQAGKEESPAVQPLQPILTSVTPHSEAAANTRRQQRIRGSKHGDVIAEIANSVASLAMIATFTALATVVVVAIARIFNSSVVIGAYVYGTDAFGTAKVAIVAAAAAVISAVVTALFAAIAARAANRSTMPAIPPEDKTATDKAVTQVKHANLAIKISGITAIAATSTAAVAALIVPFAAKASEAFAISWGMTTAARTAAATTHTTGIIGSVSTAAYLPHALIALSVACSLCLLIHIAVDIYLARIPSSQPRGKQRISHQVADRARSTFSKGNSLQPKSAPASPHDYPTRGHSAFKHNNPAGRSMPCTSPTAADPKHTTLVAAISVVMICSAAFLMRNYAMLGAVSPAAALLLYGVIAWVRKMSCHEVQEEVLSSKIDSPTAAMLPHMYDVALQTGKR